MNITTLQAAQIIGCGRRHVTKLILAGKIQAVRFNDNWMVDEASARTYAADEQARKPGARKRLDEYGWPLC